MTSEPTSIRPTVTVVIPTCANAEALERSVLSVLDTGYTPLQIVVVENRPPSAATRQVVEGLKTKGCIRYVEEPSRGASRARNAGLALAEGEIVAFTDDDVVVDPHWIDTAVAAFDAQDGPACVTGRILPLSLENRAQTLFEQFAAFDKGPERRIFRLPDSRTDDPLFPYVAGHFGSGASIFVRREVALAMGGFDPVLGPGTPSVGGEDLDFFVRLAQAGHTIMYEPGVVLRHDHPDGRDGLRRHAYRYGIGLTAMLGKQLVRGPNRVELLTAIPAGLRYGLDPRSRKNVLKATDYPKSLDRLERFGMLLGPAAYLLSVGYAATRHLPKRASVGRNRVISRT